MDILSLITQTNAVSILFFCITAILVTYEFVLFLREKKKKVRPIIPGFSSAKSPPVAASKPSGSHAPAALKKQRISPRKNVVAGIAGLVILATTGLIVYITVQNNNKSALPPISSQAQSDTTQELIDIASDAATLDQTATESADTTASTETLADTGTQMATTESATLSESEAEASDAANLISSDEAEIITLDQTDLDDAATATLAAATSTEPSPTPITELPLTSTYQYFFTAVAAASAIVIASLVF